MIIWSLKYRYGTITDYTIDKEKYMITVYFSFYHKDRPMRKRFCRMKLDRFCHIFRNLPIYRRDGTLDLSCLEGMRVGVKAVKWLSRIFVREIAFDLSYYGLSEEGSNQDG